MAGLLHVGPLAAPACQPDEEELVLDLLKVAELVGLRLQTAGESRGPLQIAGKVRNGRDLEEEPSAFSCTFDEKGGGDSESLCKHVEGPEGWDDGTALKLADVALGEYFPGQVWTGSALGSGGDGEWSAR